MTKEELIAFETDIAKEFEEGHIKAPVHLSGGNEDDLIRIFQNVKPEAWVFSTHRSHYHALLKGVPPELVKAEVMAGHSITLNFAEYKFFSSAIVGGIAPIALGVALRIKRDDKWAGYDLTDAPAVWCFVGDMAAETGIFHECVKYAEGHKLPIAFIIECNGFSVNTPTTEVWHMTDLSNYKCVKWYSYARTFGHQGTGVYVVF